MIKLILYTFSVLSVLLFSNNNLPVFSELNYKTHGYINCDPYSNGENFFISNAVEDDTIIFDIGANQGIWTDMILATGRSPKAIHLFEPIPQLGEALNKKFTRNDIIINTIALSDILGKQDFYVYDYDMYSSFYDRKVLKSHNKKKIIVNTTTIDAYCAQNNIESIDLLKMDVEGAEWKVLSGADQMIKNNKIQTIFFEYGGCNLDSGTTLEQIYTYLRRHNFKIYRLSSVGLLHIKNWSNRLENYKYSNYVAVKK